MKKVFFAAMALSLSALCFSCGGSKSSASSASDSSAASSSAASSSVCSDENANSGEFSLPSEPESNPASNESSDANGGFTLGGGDNNEVTDGQETVAVGVEEAEYDI